MVNLFFQFSMLAFEAQQAVWLRAMRLSLGGAAGDREAQLMVSEKVTAARQATVKLMSGAAPATIVRGYRRKVRGNVRRLSRKRAFK